VHTERHHIALATLVPLCELITGTESNRLAEKLAGSLLESIAWIYLEDGAVTLLVYGESISQSIRCCCEQIKIEILDVNDNAPEFPQRRLRQRIAESMDPQSSGIAVPPATDPDAGRNAIHKYEIYSTTDQFILDARHTADGGTDLRLLLRQPLDREHQDRFVQ